MLLHAEPRQPKKDLKKLRQIDNKIPAIVYGHGFKSQPLALNYLEFEKLNKTVSESTLIDLKIGNGVPYKVLIYELERHPLSNKINHIDFYKVKMDEKLRTELELEFTGESPAVKNLGGVLVKTRDTLEIECLPGNLISKYKINISSLKNFHNVIRVSDLKIPAGITVIEDKEVILISVSEPRKEEEKIVAKDAEKEAIAKIEEADKDKKEEEDDEESKTQEEGAGDKKN